MAKVGMISLGCNKNQIDAEIMLSLLCEEGFELSADINNCDVVVVNTCGFIEAARVESIENILEICRLKDEGVIKAVVVTGCMAQRYREQIAQSMPEVDVILGLGANKDIVGAVKQALLGKHMESYPSEYCLPLNGERILTTPPHYAYIKIAEGCNNFCSYCAIPYIRGRYRSREEADILKEAEELAQRGVKELIVIAQDTTRYGDDLKNGENLARLLRKLAQIEKLRWIRVLYCYPERISDELIETLASTPKLTHYMDIPIQHCADPVLKRMNRQSSEQELRALMQKLRTAMPDMAIRTTLMVGFPGETQEDFERLCRFVEDMRFDRLGVFAYSREEDTRAYDMPGQIDEDVKNERAQIIMDIQAQVAFQKSEELVGKTLTVMADGYDAEQGLYIGRSYMDCPDIDTLVYFESEEPVLTGGMVNVQVTSADGYDVFAKRI